MADILIRGMEMPQECRSCPFHHETYLRTRHICLANKNEEIEHLDIVDPFCPLLSLPEWHGRLVDAREVLEKADKAPWFDCDVSELGLLLESDVTTIVPAEGGAEDA